MCVSLFPYTHVLTPAYIRTYIYIYIYIHTNTHKATDRESSSVYYRKDKSCGELAELESKMPQPHILIVTFPARGHINPSLHFSGRLIRTTGARVTFATCVSAFRRSMIPPAAADSLSFLSFSDGFDDGHVSSTSSDYDHDQWMDRIRVDGTKTLSDFIESNRRGESPVTCLVYTLLLTWAPAVARRFHIPSSLLWIQPALVFDIYYYYFNGYAEVVSKALARSDPVELPKLPLLAARDLPSFLTPSNMYKYACAAFQDQIDRLREDPNPKILVNTCDALEREALRAIPNLEMVAVGPLLPMEIFPGNNNRFSGDSIRDSEDHGYTLWLDSKPDSSVIYVSFGTLAVLPKKQMQELAKALIETKRPFLWVITDKPNKRANEEEEGEEIGNIADFRQELEEIGMVVTWCSQTQVLKHKSVGCFLTHCGWNSTLESLVLGVPVVAFPQWTDQPTNAKLLEDWWKTGVRVKENEEGLVESGEIRRCLEAAMEDKAEELRRNAGKWRDLAAEAGGEGGSSDTNIAAFVESCGGMSYGTDDKSASLRGNYICPN
ncbi:PREDICTED: UDP-glycosyltransferase 75B2-like [Tarenaya hassleriana]|uniref:UDP-glycosyltransferase 75B2-like n=1 Tax=Tarenaya hassleriana TaxID=28532 RepID=UPI00053C17FF|nr:PREDICTED: UDP-glycosyltransferase 75B2-like [Tarenaya hassleriana]